MALHRIRTACGLLTLSALMMTIGTGMRASRDREVTLPAGTKLVAVLRQTLSTKESAVGDRVELKTAEAFQVGEIMVPAGLGLSGQVSEAKGGGRVTGRARLGFNVTQLEVEGRTYEIVTEPFEVHGKSESKNTLKKVVIGAAAGGVVGAVAGNAGKGVLIGSVLGTGVAVATTGGDIILAEGQQVGVRLAKPVTIMLRSPLIPSQP
jgi:hypothetical protein